MQRRLTGLGFDTKVSGKFDEATRAVITRWQAARGYPQSGFLNALQLKALQSEIIGHQDRFRQMTATTSRRATPAITAAAAAAIIAALADPARSSAA